MRSLSTRFGGPVGGAAVVLAGAGLLVLLLIPLLGTRPRSDTITIDGGLGPPVGLPSAIEISSETRIADPTPDTDLLFGTTTTAPDDRSVPATNPPDTSPADDVPEDSLENIEPYPVAVGYRELDRWLDGEHIRATIYAATTGDADVPNLLAFLDRRHGGWRVRSSGSGSDGTAGWRLVGHDTHSWCLWIEVYAKGLERRRDEQRLGLPGQQYLVVETPYCEPVPDGYT